MKNRLAAVKLFRKAEQTCPPVFTGAGSAKAGEAILIKFIIYIDLSSSTWLFKKTPR